MKLEATYTIGIQLLHLLRLATGNSKYEIYSIIQDLSHVCFVEMDTEQKMSSWKKVPYPALNLYLKINATREGCNSYPKPDIVSGEIKANVKVELVETNTNFSSKQVEQFLVEKILLGAE